jgi:hypothetical protein
MTTTTIFAGKFIRRSVLGDIARVVITVTAAQGTPSGTITWKLDGGTERTQDFSGGGANFDLVMPPLGEHKLTATFSGSGLFLPSNAKKTLTVKDKVLVTRP